MRILVSGSRGFIGSALVELLSGEGHEVLRLVRKSSFKENGDFVWDPVHDYVDTKAFAGCDAVVHLAAENISGRWTEEKMRKIRDSRVRGAKIICDGIKSLEQKPAVYVSASGVGYYGDRGQEEICEDAAVGNDFLAGVSKDREDASNSLSEFGVRVANMRFGMVLGRGGPLEKMLGAYRAGLGGPFGNGRQYWSWIARDDAVRAIYHVIKTESISGPVNTVSPEAVTNKQFADTLGKILNKPVFMRVPGWLARGMLGKLADSLLLSSIRAVPKVLVESGFVFNFPQPEGALRNILLDQ